MLYALPYSNNVGQLVSLFAWHKSHQITAESLQAALCSRYLYPISLTKYRWKRAIRSSLLKARKPYPTHIGIAVWQMSSCNVHHESTVSLEGLFVTIALTIFPLFTIALVTANFAIVTNLPLQFKMYLNWKGILQLQYAISTLHCAPSFNRKL